MKIGLIIPWRETPSRIRPLEMVLQWYQTNLPEVEIFYTDRPGEFWNAAASRNDGVKRAQEAHCDVIILNDADTLPEIKPLLEAIEQCQTDGMIHNPYRLCKYFDMQMSESIYSGSNMNILKHTLFTEANGGVWVCTPETWWSVGGMDEKFKQWGAEDSAFELAHTIIKGSKFIRHDGTIYCLGHQTQIHDPGFNHNQMKNIELYWLYYSAKTPERMLALVKQKTNHD
jgi:predicted glycosyltransferase involved in capsule biosynthesis